MSDQAIDYRRHTARRTHQKPCLWCGEAIVKGDRWAVRVSSCDGELCSLKMHEECDEAFSNEFQHYFPGSFL